MEWRPASLLCDNLKSDRQGARGHHKQHFSFSFLFFFCCSFLLFFLSFPHPVNFQSLNLNCLISLRNWDILHNPDAWLGFENRKICSLGPSISCGPSRLSLCGHSFFSDHPVCTPSNLLIPIWPPRALRECPYRKTAWKETTA